jgi:hypothetical protein
MATAWLTSLPWQVVPIESLDVVARVAPSYGKSLSSATIWGFDRLSW